MDKIESSMSNIFGEGMLNREGRYSKVEIKHIPVMITDNGKILCIPQNKESFHIGITAMSSRGKGILGNALLGMENYMNKIPCVIMNDFQVETFENSLPCMKKEFNENLKIIHVNPTGLPIVYVYPSNRHLIIDEVEALFPHIKMSLPTEAIIKNIEHYYKLDKSAKYVTGYIDKFLECRDLEQIKDVLDEILPEEGKKFVEMKFKILTSFKNIFDEKLCNSVAPEAPAFLKVHKIGGTYTNLTIQALMYCGLIPSLQTSEIRNRRWFAAYLAHLVQAIYDDMYHDSFFKNIRISMYVPEIDKTWKGENGEIIKEAFGLIGTNGRRAGIGLRWDAQDYDAIPDSIRANTRYLFVLRKANAEEVKGITRDFSVDRETVQKILHLNTDAEKGIFECVALTVDKFIVYNPQDGKVTEVSGPVKGRLITPMSQHKKPGIDLKSVLGIR